MYLLFNRYENMNYIKCVTNLLSKQSLNANQNLQQIRTKYVNHWMVRDVKRRKVVTEYAPSRLRINSLRKNDILPPELREIADAEIAALPRDSVLMRLTNRCVVTSRGKGAVVRWRFSRIIFRHLADYNKLAGIQRAMW